MGVFHLFDVECDNETCVNGLRERVAIGYESPADQALWQATEKGWTYDWRRIKQELLCPACSDKLRSNG